MVYPEIQFRLEFIVKTFCIRKKTYTHITVRPTSNWNHHCYTIVDSSADVWFLIVVVAMKVETTPSPPHLFSTPKLEEAFFILQTSFSYDMQQFKLMFLYALCVFNSCYFYRILILKYHILVIFKQKMVVFNAVYTEACVCMQTVIP